jgi:hypothetical protein
MLHLTNYPAKSNQIVFVNSKQDLDEGLQQKDEVLVTILA